MFKEQVRAAEAKRTVRCVIALALCGLLAACGSSSAAPAQPQETVTATPEVRTVRETPPVCREALDLAEEVITIQQGYVSSAVDAIDGLSGTALSDLSRAQSEASEAVDRYVEARDKCMSY